MLNKSLSKQYFHRTILKSFSTYNYSVIEKKWRDRVINPKYPAQNGKYFYVLSMFPYPSGKLHLGHARVYSTCDVIARYYRLKGYKVKNPIGWDSFGLPAENAAIAHNVSPEIWTNSNIKVMRDGLYEMGMSFDYDDEIMTSSPLYYHWTQWLFIQLFKQGLAYQKEGIVNWDPVDKTVLADEQVDEEGRSWRSGALIEKKSQLQWYFRITKYANRLKNDLSKLKEWPEAVRNIQKGWIGESKGANIKFKFSGRENDFINVYTTRLDTLYGVTFIAISPHHPYVNYILQTHDRDTKKLIYEIRNSVSTDTGMELKGYKTPSTLINPLTNEEIPLYIANYVVDTYATQAIMGCPGHDLRDYEFAKLYNIPIKTVIKGSKMPHTNEGILTNSGEYTNLTSKEAKKRMMEKLVEMNLGEFKTNYRLHDWSVSRQRYWGVPIPIIHCHNCGAVPVPENELPLVLPSLYDDEDISKLKNRSPLHSDKWRKTKCPKCGGNAFRDTDTLDTFVDSSWYYLRYHSSHDENKIFDSKIVNNIGSVNIYIGGIEHAYQHLLYSRFIHKFLYDLKLLNFDEPFSKLLTPGILRSTSYRSKSTGMYLSPSSASSISKDDLIIEMEKMSKSKLNGIKPRLIISQYGVDVLRLSILFAAPIDRVLDWEPQIPLSQLRWLNRINELVENVKKSKEENTSGSNKNKNKNNKTIPLSEKYKLESLKNETIKKVSDYLNMESFHTAIASLMKYFNNLYDLKEYSCSDEYIDSLKTFFQLLYPFAPHISLEMYNELKNENEKEVDEISWPKNKKLLTKLILVELNGKVKYSEKCNEDLSDEEYANKYENKISKEINTKEKKVMKSND